MALFDLFSAAERSKLQILNRRFYFGIMPHWMCRVKVNTAIRVIITENLAQDEEVNKSQIARY